MVPEERAVCHSLVCILRSTVVGLGLLLGPGTVSARECSTTLKVGLDIGHSPAAPGATSASGKTEYTFNKRFVLELGETARKHLMLNLININSEERDLTLDERTAIAKKHSVDLFVSIHHDSVNKKYWRENIVDGVKSIYSNAFRGFSIFVSPTNIEYQKSLLAARLVARKFKEGRMMQTLHHAEPIPGEGRKIVDWDLGVYDAPFAVLKTAASPSILIELGVIIHPDEELVLEDPGYRARAVEYIIAALTDYCAALQAGTKKQ